MKKGLLVCLLLVLSFVVVGCGKKDPIVGEWAYGSGSTFVFKFNEDKTCSYAGRNCTYTVDGDKLSILYEGNTAAFESEYPICKDISRAMSITIRGMIYATASPKIFSFSESSSSTNCPILYFSGFSTDIFISLFIFLRRQLALC